MITMRRTRARPEEDSIVSKTRLPCVEITLKTLSRNRRPRMAFGGISSLVKWSVRKKPKAKKTRHTRVSEDSKLAILEKLLDNCGEGELMHLSSGHE